METKEKMDTQSIVSKPEYASSEFSTEAPPAYKLRSANSVKIAKIIAFTVILSSFILGSFLLASTYLQAKATCDQVSALDAVLDKELMLEAMQQELPRAESLQSREATKIVQDLSHDEMNHPNKKDDTNPDEVETINSENSIDNDEDSNDMLKRIRVKMPLDFDLTELAHNILMNNQKSRMNCVVERRRTEEVNENSMNPFSAFLEEEKPKEKVTGERVSIFCETGAPKSEEPIVHVRRIIMPFPGPFANPMNQINQMNPMQHRFGPPQMPPQFPPMQNQMNFPHSPQMTQIRFPFPPAPQMSYQPMPQNVPQQQQQSVPPFPAQMMTPPRPEIPQFRLISPAPQQPQIQNFERPQMPNFERPQMPNFERPQIFNFERPQSQSQENPQESQQMPQQPEVRIQLRRIQIPGQISEIFPFLNNMNMQNDMQKEIEAPRENNNIHVQQVPLAVALSKVGITPDDLRNIQRMAEEKFQQHIRELVADEADNDSSSIDSDSNQSDEIESSGHTDMPDSEEDKNSSIQESQQQQQDGGAKSEEIIRPEILALGRSNFGRSLTPIQLPVRQEIQEAERAVFVQPR